MTLTLDTLAMIGTGIIFFTVAALIIDRMSNLRKITSKELEPFVDTLWINYCKEYDKQTYPNSKKKYQTKQEYIANNMPFIINEAINKCIL